MECFEYSAIVTAELWTERVMIYYVVNEPGAWADPANIQSMVVDTGQSVSQSVSETLSPKLSLQESVSASRLTGRT